MIAFIDSASFRNLAMRGFYLVLESIILADVVLAVHGRYIYLCDVHLIFFFFSFTVELLQFKIEWSCSVELLKWLMTSSAFHQHSHSVHACLFAIHYIQRAKLCTGIIHQQLIYTIFLLFAMDDLSLTLCSELIFLRRFLNWKTSDLLLASFFGSFSLCRSQTGLMGPAYGS